MFLLLAMGTGCGPGSELHTLDSPQRIDPDVLRTLPLPKLVDAWPDSIPADAPKRIVSVIPSVTELLFALGLGDRVVGRHDWSDWPPEAETRPSLGNQQTLSVERVADLKPDLVIFWSHLPDKKAELSGLFKLDVITPGTESREEALHGMVEVASACRVPKRGLHLESYLMAGLERVRNEYRGQPRVRVLLVLDRGQAFYVPGKDSFLQEIFDIANAENVAAGLDAGKWPAVSIERILDWNPDVILDLSLGAASTREQVTEARKFWQHHDTLAAVRSGRVIVLNAGVLVRPGPRLVAVTEEFARIVHGAP